MRTPNLKLTAEQITELGAYAKQRYEALCEDNAERIKADKKSYQRYERKRKDREKPDTIFEHSNFSLPLTTMIVDSFVARADDAITGTAPYFHFKPRGASDGMAAQEFDDFFRFKLETKAKTRGVLQDGYEPIFIQRAAFFKAIYAEDFDEWVDYEKNVLWNAIEEKPVRLIDPATNEPTFIVEGEHQFVTVLDPVTGIERQQSASHPYFFLNPEIQEWRPAPKGLLVRSELFRGAKAVPVDYDAILVPSSATDIKDADVIERYDKPVTWAKSMWTQRKGMTFEEFEQSLKAKDAKPKTQTERNQESKENLSFDMKAGRMKVLECWFTRDIQGKGRPQRFVVWVDADNFTPISWEYRGMVSPSGYTPYKAIAIAKKSNRWWGYSLPEMLEEPQEFIDKQFNSQAYRNELATNPFVGRDESALDDDEEEDPENFPGKLFNLKNNKKISDYISFAEMPKLDGKTQELIEFVIEIVQLWLGVSDLTQGDSEDISKHNTATGIEATLKEASKLSRKWIRRIVRGYSELLSDLVYLTIDTIEPREVYEVTERDTVYLREMNVEDIRSIDFDVTLVMSQNEGGRKIENARAALETQQFYLDLLMKNPDMARVSRPLLVSILRELGFADSDTLLPNYGQSNAAPPEELQAMQAQFQAQQEREAALGGGAQKEQEMLPTR